MTSDEENAPALSQNLVTCHTSLVTFLAFPIARRLFSCARWSRCDPGKSVEARTSFDADDPMFAGHFPGNPIVPGVILTEALAQAAGIAAASGYPETAQPLFLLSAIRTMKFLQAVRPGDRDRLARGKDRARPIALLQFKVEREREGDIVVAEGQLVLSVSRRTLRAAPE